MRRQFVAVLAASVIGWSCAAVLGIEPAELVTPQQDARTGATDAGGTETSVPLVFSDNACTKEPACDAEPDPARGFFVDGSRGADSTSCGTRTAPCKTIQSGLERARTAPTPGLGVFVAPGEYVEALSLHAGAAIIGGFDVEGERWSRRCVVEAITKVSIVAPSSSARTISALDIGGRAALDSVFVKSKATAAPGESLYGIFSVADATSLCLANVVVEVARGGDGLAGTTGATGSVRTCNGADGGEDSAPGGDGDAGSSADAGAFDESGWSAGPGGPGAIGTRGHDGAYRPAKCPHAECSGNATCKFEANICVPTTGGFCPMFELAGCGGGPGVGGGGGAPAGSSIALFVHSATVDVFGGALVARAGGAGGSGGDGGVGANGAAGDAGTCMHCPDVDPCELNPAPVVEAPVEAGVAVPGGHGGAGGSGGNGASGVSCAVYNNSFGRITSDKTRLERVDAGNVPSGCGP